jgi:hypothetical protein
MISLVILIRYNRNCLNIDEETVEVIQSMIPNVFIQSKLPQFQIYYIPGDTEYELGEELEEEEEEEEECDYDSEDD